MLRIFIGIKIEPSPIITEHRAELIKIAGTDQINWANPLNYHITLKFFGDVEEYYINSLNQLIEQIASRTETFTLQYDRLGFFGSEKQPRVLWFGFKNQPAVQELQKSIEKAGTDLGFQPEEKKFHPHLTLARIKKINNAQPLMQYIKLKNPGIYGKYCVEKFQLFKSVLHPSGPEYTVLKEFRLH